MGGLKILVACEVSGVVRRALRKLGHEAISCDLLPPDDGSIYHYQGDVMDIIYDGWDMMLAFPDCTYLTNSGVRWLYNSDRSKNLIRWGKMRRAAYFFRNLLEAEDFIPKVVVENPIMHGHAMNIIKRKYSQIVQPWQFGHGETKATCLWLSEGLPLLVPTNIVSGREHRIHKMGPSPNRSKLRSETYPGVADALAQQLAA